MKFFILTIYCSKTLMLVFLSYSTNWFISEITSRLLKKLYWVGVKITAVFVILNFYAYFGMNFFLNMSMLFTILKCKFCSTDLCKWFDFLCLFSTVKFKMEKSKSQRLYSMSSKWDVKQQKLFIISSKYLATGSSKNVQLNVGSKSSVMEMRALKMRRVADILLQLTTTN